jgi:hypothetical protein
MARFGPAQAFIVIDEYDMSTFTYSISQQVESLMEEVHGLGDSWEEQVPIGLARTTIEADGGVYDDTLVDTVFSGQAPTATERILTTGPGKNIGEPCDLINGVFATQYNRVASRSALTKANVAYTVSGTNYPGFVLHGFTSETTASGDTESSPVDHGSGPTTGGGVAHLHLTELTLDGYTDLTVTVRDSPDDITYSDLVAFTAATTVGAERVSVAGDVEQYLAIDWVLSGTGTSPTFTPFVAFARL